MAMKDYAKKSNNSTRRRKKSKSGGNNQAFVVNFNPMLILVIVAGSIFGGSVFYIEYFKGLIEQLRHPETTASSKTLQVAKADKKGDVNLKVTPRFEFYRTLPKMQVAVDNSENADRAINKLPNKIPAKLPDVVVAKADAVRTQEPAVLKTNTTANSSTPANVFVLQLASFKEMKEAEQLKAKLILAGFDVIIQAVTLASGDVWYRVKTNQLSNMALAQNINDRLKQHNIKGIVLTEKLNS